MPIVSPIRLLQTRQQKNELMMDYSTRFTEQLDMVEACNGSVMVSNSTKNHLSNKWYQLEYDGLTDDQRSKIQPGLKAYVESTLFLMTAGGHAAHVKNELNNVYVQGNENYPSDITSARAFIVNYSTTAQQPQPPQQ